MSLKNRIASLLLLITIIFTLSFPALTFASTSPTITRLAGTDRYVTATAIAKQGWTQSDYAVLAYGENFPDALSAVVLAKKYNAPILLTSGSSLPDVTKQTLTTLQVKNVFIIGGTGVIPTSIDSELQSMGITPIRIAGQDRYETSVKIAQQITSPSELIVTTGEDYPDALSIAPIAGMKQIPIILVPAGYLPDSVKNYISTLNINKTYVLGDSSIIEDSVCNQFPNPERIVGSDKYERNIAINKEFDSNFNAGSVCIASGEGFADALTGAAYASKISEPIILVNSVTATDTKNYYQQLFPNENNIYVFGGTGVVSDNLMQELVSEGSNNNSTGTYTPSQIANVLNPSIVNIETFDQDGNENGVASGFICDANGKIGTNYHVIQGAYSAKVTLSNGQVYDVENVLGYDSNNDIAELKINATGLSPVILGDSDNVSTGDKVFAIGNPLGLNDTISDGLISTKNRQINGMNYIQISVPISPGSSGGVLVNEQAQVIGITSAGMRSGENLNFAIPINTYKTILASNQNLTLKDLNANKMTDSDFVNYLNSKYGTITDNGTSIRIKWKSKSTVNTDYDVIDVGVINPDDYDQWKSCIGSNSNNLYDIFYKISKDIANNYPSKLWGGGIFYENVFNSIPMDFPTEDIKLNVITNNWYVVHRIAYFYGDGAFINKVVLGK
ncbi:MAG: cell wall-binding repeat-containing protein [Desulfosporosinus sp.]|nr:cell wall-binding repeat-containing protein [Desulfosporosinus sp.]